MEPAELLLTIGEVQARYRPGDWYHLPPGTEHGARFEKDTAELELWFTHDGSDD